MSASSAFAGAVAFLTVLVCGLWPAIVVGRLDALSVLAHGPATTGCPAGGSCNGSW